MKVYRNIFTSLIVFLFTVLSAVGAGVAAEGDAKTGVTKTELLTRLAESAFNNKQYEKAAGYYRQLRQAGATLTTAQILRLSSALESNDQAEQALAELQAELKNRPQEAELVTETANLLLLLKRPQEAIDLWRRLIKLKPDDRENLVAYANAAMWGKSFPDVRDAFGKLLELEPGNPEFSERLADALFWDGQPVQALPRYRVLLETRGQDDDFIRRYADCALGAHEYETAMKQYERLVASHPDDPALERSYIFALHLHGEKKLARERLDALLLRTPDDFELFRLAGDLALEEQDYLKAAASYRQTLANGDKRDETRLRLARVLSWDQLYAEALAEYDLLLVREPRDWHIWREKARALGWARNYVAALAEYSLIIEANPDVAAVALERQAKQAYYASDDHVAIPLYLRLIEAEPDNLEAHFDLAQAYSHQSIWREARQCYEKVISIYPNHFRAREALALVDQITHAWVAVPSYNYEMRKSPGRLTGIRLHESGVSVTRWLRDDLRLGISAAHENYSFGGAEDLDADVLRVRGLYSSRPAWETEIELGVRNLTDEAGAQFLYDARLRLQPGARLRGEVYSVRHDQYDNRRNLVEGLYRIDNGASLEFRPVGSALLKTWGQRGYCNDGNRREELGGEAYWELLPAPRSFSLGYYGQYYEFAEQKDDYFSPGNFWTQEVRAEWRHYLSKDELFWGSKRTYYFLDAKYSWDKSHEPGLGFAGGLRHDFGENSRVELELATHKSDVYREHHGKFFLTLDF
jgi:tetratricopeptide (TPR) repeat protein